MIKVAIMALESATSLSTIGILEMFIKTSKIPCFDGVNKNDAYFKPSLVGLSDKVTKTSSGVVLNCDSYISNNQYYDLVIIPSCDGNIEEVIENNKTLIPWLVSQYNNGATLSSVCTGSFLLAKTGLLKGKTITTHWAYFDLLKRLYPDSLCEISHNIIDHGKLVLAGGGVSFCRLVIYLIEKYYGHQFAILCAKFMVIDPENQPESVFSIFIPNKSHGDKQILAAQEFIELNFLNKLTIEQIASNIHLGTRSLMRRFKKCTGMSVNNYIQNLRVEKAKKLLESSAQSIQTIMYEVGYRDIKSFRKAFSKHTGLNFKDYKKKFSSLVHY